MLARLDDPGRHNDWGRVGDTREFLRGRLRRYHEELRAFGAIAVDATQPVDLVADAILAHTYNSGRAPVDQRAVRRRQDPCG